MKDDCDTWRPGNPLPRRPGRLGATLQPILDTQSGPFWSIFVTRVYTSLLPGPFLVHVGRFVCSFLDEMLAQGEPGMHIPLAPEGEDWSPLTAEQQDAARLAAR